MCSSVLGPTPTNPMWVVIFCQSRSSFNPAPRMGDLPLSLLAFAGSVVADRVDREEKAVQPVRFLSPGTPRHAGGHRGGLARRQRGSCAAAPDDDVVSCCSSGSSGAAGSSDASADCFLGNTEKVQAEAPPAYLRTGRRNLEIFLLTSGDKIKEGLSR